MSATRASIDLDDSDGLIGADRDGLLRGASMSGAQVRAVASAVAEGALESVDTGQRPRSLIWVAGRGAAESAGAMLAAVLGGAAAEPIVTASEVPPWIGPLDVLVVAGDDVGDPALVTAAATGVRRGARVVIAAPYAGPLRDATAGRVAVLEPRLWVRDEFGLCRYLATGLATLGAVETGAAAVRTDLSVMADELDAEALRNSAGREVFTNAAKSLAERMSGRDVVLAGDNLATVALARHLAAVLLRVAHKPVAAAGLADAVVALREGMGAEGGSAGSDFDALFHDEELDGPLPQRPRVLALTLAAERAVVGARVAGVSDVDLVGTEDVPDGGPSGDRPRSDPWEGSGLPAAPADAGRPEQQLAVLAVRLEMAAVYMRLARG
ncbi:TobH protein [Mycobacterium sp. MS1601]|uniref:TobH protein n=1 Tax=Mycobacterium sp. MS1601 TaxID=1936029 RepID=UPI0009792820|nr:TobH protein [Mycobacterium sp. MS1601]AQA01453.1 TobH protein [Mycobacterium sp. MS1601]